MGPLIIIGIVFFVIALGYFVHMSTKIDRENRKKLEEQLDDEYIYDPETGLKMTLEEAEQGAVFESNGVGKIKSEAEIDRIEDENIREMHRIRNYFLKSELTNVDSDEFELMRAKIASLQFANNYSSIETDFITRITENTYIALTSVAYVIAGKRGSNAYDDNQIFGIIESDKTIGTAYIIPNSIRTHIENVVTPEEEIVENSLTIRPLGDLNIELAKKLCQHLDELDDDFEVLVHQKSIYIKINRNARLDDLLAVMKMMKSYTNQSATINY